MDEQKKKTQMTQDRIRRKKWCNNYCLMLLAGISFQQHGEADNSVGFWDQSAASPHIITNGAFLQAASSEALSRKQHRDVSGVVSSSGLNAKYCQFVGLLSGLMQDKWPVTPSPTSEDRKRCSLYSSAKRHFGQLQLPQKCKQFNVHSCHWHKKDFSAD